VHNKHLFTRVPKILYVSQPVSQRYVSQPLSRRVSWLLWQPPNLSECLHSALYTPPHTEAPQRLQTQTISLELLGSRRTRFARRLLWRIAGYICQKRPVKETYKRDITNVHICVYVKRKRRLCTAPASVGCTAHTYRKREQALCGGPQVLCISLCVCMYVYICTYIYIYIYMYVYI